MFLATKEILHFFCCCFSVTQSCLILCNPMNPMESACQTSLSFTIFLSLLKLISIWLVMPSDHLIHCCPLLLLPSIFPNIRVFLMSWLFTLVGQSIGALASASVLPMNIQDLFFENWPVLSPCSPRDSQSILQHHSLKASVLQCSAFFMVQFAHLNMITGKTIALTLQTFVGKVMSLLFNMLSVCHRSTFKE